MVLNERHASCNMMNFVLDKEVEQRHDCCKESASEYFAILDRFWIRRAEFDTADGPGHSSQEIRDHEDIMPIVIIRGSDIRPTTASECSEYSNSCYPLWQSIAFSRSHKIPQCNQGESWAGCHGNENLEDGALRIAVTNCSGDRGKPFLRV